MRKLLIVFVLVFPSVVCAGGWTSYEASGDQGSIDYVEVVRAQGFMVIGKLGNPAGCTRVNYLWVSINHPQYDQLYSTVLAAFMGGKKIHAYASTCSEIGWHSGSFNTLTSSGALYIKN